VDVILSYSHLTLQNSTFSQYSSQFRARAKVGQLLVASPFSMGLLTPTPPAWHPAPPVMINTTQTALNVWPQGLPNLALGFSIRHTGAANGNLPLVVGFSKPSEVHECLKVWRELHDEEHSSRKETENLVQEIFKDSGYLDWSWASP